MCPTKAPTRDDFSAAVHICRSFIQWYLSNEQGPQRTYYGGTLDMYTYQINVKGLPSSHFYVGSRVTLSLLFAKWLALLQICQCMFLIDPGASHMSSFISLCHASFLFATQHTVVMLCNHVAASLHHFFRKALCYFLLSDAETIAALFISLN